MASFITQPYNILVRDGRDTRKFGSRCCINIRRGNFTKTLARTPRTDRRRLCILDVQNRVLLVVIWLRQYLKLHVLAYIFCISKSIVAEEIYHVVPILFTNYRRFIK